MARSDSSLGECDLALVPLVRYLMDRVATGILEILPPESWEVASRMCGSVVESARLVPEAKIGQRHETAGQCKQGSEEQMLLGNALRQRRSGRYAKSDWWLAELPNVRPTVVGLSWLRRASFFGTRRER